MLLLYQLLQRVHDRLKEDENVFNMYTCEDDSIEKIKKITN